MTSMLFKILITGANKGLGYWLAYNWLLQGNTVFSLNRSSSPELAALQNAYPHNLFIYEADVRACDRIQSAFTQIKQITPSLDIIVNNAAVYLEDSKNASLEKLDFEKMLETYNINAIGPLRVLKTFLPLLKSGTKKTIANISSEAGSITDQARTGEYAYCMSKAALNMASKILQNSFKNAAIKVLAVHPGWFSSDMGGPAAPISPEAAAGPVSMLILKDWQQEGPVYLDYNGNKLNW
jgi:NAD(P)-dependent dehydrogenase (short-subunit alcohol dehydrogenase family)